MNLVHLLLRNARARPDAPAIAVGRRVLATYGQLGRRVARLSAAVRRKLSLAPGDRIGLAMENCPEYLELLFASWHAGLVAVPMNAKLHPRELAYIVENSGARVSVTGDGVDVAGALPLTELRGLDAEPDAPAELGPDTPAWLFYTSGTTGVPKGAVLTHRNLLFEAQAYFADIDRIAVGDAMLHAAPLSHGSGLYSIPHVAGGSVQVIPESDHFDSEEVFALLDHWPGISLFAAPTMVVRLMASPAARSPRHLKTLIYGGAPMYLSDCLRAIDLFGPRLFHLYGQGESPMTITGLPQREHADRTNLDTCGIARTGVEVKIVDDDDAELPAGASGEIVTRSDCMMAGYWGNAEASAHTLRNGWLHTGDIGSVDARGYLTLLDRSKDLIISGGSNIYPREVEEVLLQHPAVAECSVVGRPHPEWGEEVVAFVVAATPVQSEALDAHCLQNIARFKRPREYRFVQSLPKNNYGKVLKTKLREMAKPACRPE